MFLSSGAPVPASTDTLADRTPLFADASYYPRESLSLLGQFAAYGAVYRSQLWVSVLVNKLARATARLPLTTRRLGDRGRTALTVADHPLPALLDRPTPQLDGYRLWLWTSSTFDIYGEAFWLKLRNRDGSVAELQPMHPSNVIVRRPSGSEEPTYYYAPGVRDLSQLPPIPAADVVPFVSYSPDTLVRGMSPLEPLRQTLYAEDAARRATASWWQRGARPSVAIKHPSTLSEGAQERIRRTWSSAHEGADLMGGTAVLEEGMDIQTVQLSAEEMQYIESRKLNREEVCAAFDVPPPAAHILDRATFSNVTENLRSVYRDTMAGRLPLFESALAHHLLPDYPDAASLQLSFDLDDVLRGDFETRAESAEKLVQSGVMKPAEARVMFNLDDAGSTADQLYGNAALVPLGSTAQAAPTPGPSIPSAPRERAAASVPPHLTSAAAVSVPASATAALPRGRSYDARSLAGRLGRLKGHEDELHDGLLTEHTDALTDYIRRLSAAVQEWLQRKDAGPLPDGTGWTDELASVLLSLGLATTKLLGGTVAKDLGGEYDPGILQSWLEEETRSSAENVVSSIGDGLQHALDTAEPGTPPAETARSHFASLEGDRVPELAQTRVTTIGGKASRDAARVAGAAHKTWHVMSSRPRPSHAAMSGKTASLGEPFSNGMQGPGDPSGGPNETAGCTCRLSFEHADTGE